MILGPNQEADLEKIIIKLGELQTERGILASIGLTAGMALIMLGAGAINFNLNILGSIQNLWWEMDNRLMGSTPWNPA